jgi:RNA polymerase sigma-70 factor (ECF subfamily)
MENKYCNLNNSETLNDIYKNYKSLVFSTSFKIVKDFEVANDLTQDVFLKLFDNLLNIDFENGGELGAWLKITSKNISIDYIRKNKRFTEYDGDYMSETIDELDFDNLGGNNEALLRCVTNTIQTLPEKQMLAIKMFYLDNLSHEEISDELGISLGTSKSNLHKGKIKLIKLLNNNKIKTVYEI